MTTAVFMVDGVTRIILADTQWARDVLDLLRQRGHIVQRTGQDPNLCVRDQAELTRMDELLDSTGQ